MRFKVDERHVIEATSRFWDQMLAMKLEPEPILKQFCVGHKHLLGRIDLKGAWKGRVEIRMAEDLARAATAAMMMQPIETVAEADMMDAISEVANMIAGVIKSSLPQPCEMSLPHSAVELCNFCGVEAGGNAIDVAFRHAEGKMVVRVWEDE
ncbi:MAG: chemotaxis protein CheX [Terracidiphilus sp.]|jgi:CheY-specific phosphatase CheX